MFPQSRYGNYREEREEHWGCTHWKNGAVKEGFESPQGWNWSKVHLSETSIWPLKSKSCGQCTVKNSRNLCNNIPSSQCNTLNVLFSPMWYSSISGILGRSLQNWQITQQRTKYKVHCWYNAAVECIVLTLLMVTRMSAKLWFYRFGGFLFHCQIWNIIEDENVFMDAIIKKIIWCKKKINFSFFLNNSKNKK